MQGTRAMTHLERPRVMVAEVKKYGGKKAQLVDIIQKSCTSSVGSWPTAHRTPWAFVHILTFHLILHTCWMLRNWSGVGGGGMITFLALAHMLDGTQLVRGGWGGA